jgi:hypothetical protein
VYDKIKNTGNKGWGLAYRGEQPREVRRMKRENPQDLAILLLMLLSLVVEIIRLALHQ